MAENKFTPGKPMAEQLLQIAFLGYHLTRQGYIDALKEKRAAIAKAKGETN